MAGVAWPQLCTTDSWLVAVTHGMITLDLPEGALAVYAALGLDFCSSIHTIHTINNIQAWAYTDSQRCVSQTHAHIEKLLHASQQVCWPCLSKRRHTQTGYSLALLILSSLPLLHMAQGRYACILCLWSSSALEVQF